MAVNNFLLPAPRRMPHCSRATNSSHPNTGVEIIVPGLGLLNSRVRLRTGQSPLGARRAFSRTQSGRDLQGRGLRLKLIGRVQGLECGVN